jgi:hypothetical protein
MPFQGGRTLGLPTPRALPWADLFRPLRGKNKMHNFKTCASI